MSPKKNILLIAHSNQFQGGANRSLLSIAKGLSQKYKVVILVPDEPGELVDILQANQICSIKAKYHRLVTKKKKGFFGLLRRINLYRKFFLEPVFVNQIVKKISQNKFDLVYTNSRTIIVGGFIAKKIGVPHIWHSR